MKKKRETMKERGVKRVGERDRERKKKRTIREKKEEIERARARDGKQILKCEAKRKVRIDK